MKLVYSTVLSVILNFILLFSVVFLIANVSCEIPIKYKPLKVTLKEVPPIENDTVVNQLGKLVTNISDKTIKPVVLSQVHNLRKKTIEFEKVNLIKKKSLNIKDKLPMLVTKNNVPVPKMTDISVNPQKKTLGEQVLIKNISKHYFQIKNVGLTDLTGRNNTYEIKNIEISPLTEKRPLNYELVSNSSEKKQINFDDLANLVGGTISFDNVSKVKQILHQKYMAIVQDAVNRNLAFPSGKVMIEAIFYPDGLIKINKIEGGNSSPALQNLLKVSIQSLSFVATKKVIMDITYNFESKPGGLK
jgi:uncharacterized protein YneF (UPF0154 family)